jgi:hypothetical protein
MLLTNKERDLSYHMDLNKLNLSWVQWCTALIPATWEAEVRRIVA